MINTKWPQLKSPPVPREKVKELGIETRQNRKKVISKGLRKLISLHVWNATPLRALLILLGPNSGPPLLILNAFEYLTLS